MLLIETHVKMRNKLHSNETERIAGRLGHNEYSLQLTIPRPVLGFRYAIHWGLITSENIQKLLELVFGDMYHIMKVTHQRLNGIGGS